MHNHIPYDNLNDEALLAAYNNDGNMDRLGYLLQRYTALLLGVALKYLKNRAEAEDAVQQVFLKALTHLPKEEILNFKGWLYVLMRNHCLQQLRNKTYSVDETAMLNISAGTRDTEELQWQDQTLEQMNEAIELLSEEQRKTIILFYFKKYSYEQVIEQTGYTFMQVKSFIQNGKRNLKSILLKKTGKKSS